MSSRFVTTTTSFSLPTGVTSPSRKRPLDSAFYQQRLAAWRPILTPQVFIPAFIFLGLLCFPIGLFMFISANSLSEVKLDYTDCDSAGPTFSVPPGRTSDEDPLLAWSYDKNAKECTLKFKIRQAIRSPVYLYYTLDNFYQNYRKYVLSLSRKQLKGYNLSAFDLFKHCYPLVGPPSISSPLDVNANPLAKSKILKPYPVYYPCGMIANSVFTDNIDLRLFSEDGRLAHNFTSKGISINRNLFHLTRYSLDQISVPPKLVNETDLFNGNDQQFSSQASNSDPYLGTPFETMPNIHENERMQVWLRTAPFPHIKKLYGIPTEESKHGSGKLKNLISPGVYTIKVQSRYDVRSILARKAIVLGNASWQGGKYIYLSLVYIVMSFLFLLTGLIFLLWHYICPRRPGDHRYLTWHDEYDATSVLNRMAYMAYKGGRPSHHPSLSRHDSSRRTSKPTLFHESSSIELPSLSEKY